MIDLAITIPFYNESEIIESFLDSLNNELKLLDANILIVFIDDNSNDNSSDLISLFSFNSNISFVILKHLVNSGNQQAIKTGLRHLSKIDYQRVLIMDSDGEDNPKNIHALLNTPGDIVVATRGVRQESYFFKSLYFLYKILFKLITGKKHDFGNFSIMSKAIAMQLYESNFIHFSASILKLKIPINRVKLDKAKRLGETRTSLNFQFFIYHGLYAFLEFSETIFYKVIKFLLFLILILILFSGYVFFQKIFTQNSIPGWTSSMLIGIGISILITFNIIITGILITYFSKKQIVVNYKKYE
jgi:polyisoprenyl-phosphate glycosyltransferase